jgi:hypothetical protein
LLLACRIEKQLARVVTQIAGRAVDLRRRFGDCFPVPARPRDINISAR